MAKKNKFNGIVCSRNSHDFILLYGGLGDFYLYYKDSLIKELKEPTTPKEIAKQNNLLQTISDIKKTTKHRIIIDLLNEIANIIGDTGKNQYLIKDALMNLIRTLKDAETDSEVNRKYFNKAPSEIKQKAMEISKNKGYDIKLFGDEIPQESIIKFKEKRELYNNCLEMLETELYDYVDNTENIFKGVIICLMALFGYGSRFIIINGGSEVGKSEYINTIEKLIPNFENMGSSTPASLRRKDTNYFKRKIVYLGDRGLKGKTQTAKDEFEGILEVIGGLITEKKFIREIVIGDEPINFELKSDGVCAFITEPYTNVNIYGAGEQYSTRSSFITVNPVKDGLSLFLQDDDSENKFYNIHKDYAQHILNNPLEITLTKEILTEIWNASRESLRTAKYLKALFKSYCQYIRVSAPVIDDVKTFLDIFKPKFKVSDIEMLVYEKLYTNLNVLKSEDLEFKIDSNGAIQSDDMLLQRSNRKTKSFFTIKQVKTYFKSDFERNKNLKDTIDQISDIINNLYKAGYINMLEWQYNKQNVYYIPYNAEMVK